MSQKEGIARILKVTILLCVVASLFVSFTAVYLKDRQDLNKLNEKKNNILQAAGFIEVGKKATTEELDRYFKKIKVSIIDFASGEKVDGDVESFDQLKLSKVPGESIVVPSDEDIAGLKRRENKGLVYEVIEAGEIAKIIVPIRGYGLWSTLFGFLALEKDGNKVVGITYYQHGETPGLGGEVDNPNWKKQWKGKKIYSDSGDVAIKVVRGSAAAGAVSDVDGLSGATITSRGVQMMLHFWLSDQGYGNYLRKFAN